MPLVSPSNNNRWIYTMHGLEKPVDNVPGNLSIIHTYFFIISVFITLKEFLFFNLILAQVNH